MKTSKQHFPHWWLALVIALVLVTIGIDVVERSRVKPARPAGVQAGPVATNLSVVPIAQTNATAPAVVSQSVTTNATFQLRPFVVARTSETCEWTAEDGKDTNVIQRLAHNSLEYQRMVEENDRIQRRQLVYRKNTAAAVMQRSRLSGEPVTHLNLPGFDGQELQFIIERADLEPSQQSGSFTGRLNNKPQSLVTLAFKFGREAFTILSPEDGVYLQAHPREPGEILLTSFDPETYQRLPGGEPIRTAQR